MSPGEFEGGIPNSTRWWKCQDCGTIFLAILARLVPEPVEEQCQHPRCMKCWHWRFDKGLDVLSGQQNPRKDGEEWL